MSDELKTEQKLTGDELMVSIMRNYGREILHLWDQLPGGMFDGLDAVALYSLIRGMKPKNILEIGSYLGRSTSLIQQAIEYNELGEFTSCDLKEQSKITQKHVRRLFPENKVKFLVGQIEDHVDEIGELDFLFIDGPHTAEFMEWCIQNLFPKVKNEGWVLIHDINMSFNGNWRVTPGTEAESLIKYLQEGKLPLNKVSWMEDFCLNHHFKAARNELSIDLPIIGEWGNLNPPNSGSLSIWIKKEVK